MVQALTVHGLNPALGGSGLLVALGLADVAHDWDVTVDAPNTAVIAALADAALEYRDGTIREGIYATSRRYVIDGGSHDVDLLVNFALHTPTGIETLPTRVTGRWRGIPLADPAVWARAYRLLGRGAKAEALERWLSRLQ
ncbi:MAG: hypothetical protein J2P17_19380 [Mycobacterium sp.]|nr:hypothetical protein [Mycobacterium sp.]